MNIQPSDSIYKTVTEIVMNYINSCNIDAIHALLMEGEVNLESKDRLGMTPLHVRNKIIFYINNFFKKTLIKIKIMEKIF